MGLHVLVLAGGSGTRLWPLSRRSTPKHLLPLAAGGETLLRATLERVVGLGESVRVVTSAAQVRGAARRLRTSDCPQTRSSRNLSRGGRARRSGWRWGSSPARTPTR